MIYALEPLKTKAKLTDPELADTIGVTERHVRRLRMTGLSEQQADEYANAVGQHPGWIWPDWYRQARGEHLPGPCRCGTRSRPLGRICDRCGHDLPRSDRRPDVLPASDTGA